MKKEKRLPHIHMMLGATSQLQHVQKDMKQQLIFLKEQVMEVNIGIIRVTGPIMYLNVFMQVV